jgi:hypothetical protein
VRNHALQIVLGSHIVPLDNATRQATVWLGLVPPQADLEAAGEALKSLIRKADVPLHTHLLRCLATDPKVAGAFESAKSSAGAQQGFDPLTAPERLTELLKKGFHKPKKHKARAASHDRKKKTKPAKAHARKPQTRSSAARRAAGKRSTRRASQPAAKKKSGSRR